MCGKGLRRSRSWWRRWIASGSRPAERRSVKVLTLIAERGWLAGVAVSLMSFLVPELLLPSSEMLWRKGLAMLSLAALQTGNPGLLHVSGSRPSGLSLTLTYGSHLLCRTPI